LCAVDWASPHRPPLTIERKEIDLGAGIFDKALAKALH